MGNAEGKKEKKKKKKGERSQYHSGLVPGVDLKVLFPDLAAKLNSDPPTTSWEDTDLKAAAAGFSTAHSKLCASIVPSCWRAAGGNLPLPPPAAAQPCHPHTARPWGRVDPLHRGETRQCCLLECGSEDLRGCHVDAVRSPGVFSLPTCSIWPKQGW